MTDSQTHLDRSAAALGGLVGGSSSTYIPRPSRTPSPASARTVFMNVAPRLAAGPPSLDALRCCCGRLDCVFLKHNCSILDSVEKDVHTAAKLGQQLLARHEAYMADAERDRTELTTRIEQLEMDKRELEAENARTIEENRSLLDHLEILNGSVLDSEVRIQTLEASLHSSQQTVRRLESAAARAEEMERHLAILEQEQASLQDTLVLTQSDARSAVQRWRKAERGISDLHEQLERMEREAKEECERHAEVLERVERNRAVERELDTAAGRLKGAAALKSIGHSNKGNTTVSHFVRDLLQDNANLQFGIAELRDMLRNSNDEIQLLREQLESHQPMYERIDNDDRSATPTLRAELLPAMSPPPQPPKTLSRDVHIHHHYHVINKQEAKKTKRKRQVLSPGVFSPLSPLSAPSSPPRDRASWGLSQGSPLTPVAVSQPVKESTPPLPSHRWSAISDLQSDYSLSSVPSSPRTNPRNSIFDGTVDTSIPTSPTTSVDPMSPSWRADHRRQSSNVSSLNFPAPLSFPDVAPPRRQGHNYAPLHAASQTYTNCIEEENESSLELPEPAAEANATPSTNTITDSIDNSRTADMRAGAYFSGRDATPEQLFQQDATVSDDEFCPTSPTRPRLHRAQSHESIMSLSGGLDIHTLKSRPSQMTIRPIGATTADIGLSAVTARPTIAHGNTDAKRRSAVIRESLSMATLGAAAAAGGGTPPPRGRIVSGPAASPAASSSADGAQQPASLRSGMGSVRKLVAWRPWSQGTGTSATAPRGSFPDTASAPTIASQAVKEEIGEEEDAFSSIASAVTEPITTAARGEQQQKHNKNGGGGGRDTLRGKDSRRPPGINQPGSVPIPGFNEYWAMHQRRGPASRVTAEMVDRDALRDGLEG